jgi:hypothetical protein
LPDAGARGLFAGAAIWGSLRVHDNFLVYGFVVFVVAVLVGWAVVAMRNGSLGKFRAPPEPEDPADHPPGG